MPIEDGIAIFINNENKKYNLYTGKQLFSLFLPGDFNYVMTSKWSKGTSGKQKDVVIKNLI